ncbi:hypothetical protein ACWOD8_06645 [Enterococcus plantarum]|uniref:hypothetical protein n=1 Tax=Enterococcus plantarum TaxID=1077675 RepID=UPI000A547383|nr:hypothetical protein [Enterococcus plantarum]
MKKLTIIAFLCLSILLTGCSNTSSKNAIVKDQPTEKNNSKSTPKTKEETSSGVKKANYYSYLDEVDRTNIQSSTVESFLMYDNTKPKSLQENTNAIFLARVISIDKADVDANLSETESNSILPDTYGKLEVLKNIEGTTDKEVSFIRSGGVIKEKDRFKNAEKEEVDKHNRLRAESGRPPITQSEDWVEVREDGDIELQAGEVYLFFATYSEERGAYILEGYQYGALLLEDDEQPISRTRSIPNEIGKTWKIKNASSGEEQDLGDYLKNELGIEMQEN